MNQNDRQLPARKCGTWFVLEWLGGFIVRKLERTGGSKVRKQRETEREENLIRNDPDKSEFTIERETSSQ